MSNKRLLLPLALLVSDAIGVFASGTVAFFLRFQSLPFPSASAQHRSFLLLLPLATVVTLICLTYFGGYRYPQRFGLGQRTLGLAVRAVLTGAMITLFLIFLLRLGTFGSARPFLYSRPVLLATGGLTLVWLGVSRVCFGRVLRWLFQRGVLLRRVAVVGDAAQAHPFADRLRREAWLGYEVVGCLTTARETGDEDLGNLDALPCLGLDEVWLTLPIDGYQETIRVVEVCRDLSITVRMTPRQFDELVNRIRVTEDQDLLHLQRMVRRDLDLPTAQIVFLGSRGIPATWGGVEKYVEQVSTRLVDRGYRATVYCRPYYMTVQGTFQGVRLRALPTIPTKHLDAIVHTALSTAHVLLHDDDIVHYQALGPSLLSFVPRLFGKRVVVTVHGLDWQRAKWGRGARYILRLGEWAAAIFPHRTIMVSETLQQHYQERYGRAMTFIPNGIEPPHPCPPQTIREWGLEKDNYVLFVGRLVPEKGCHTLVEAFQRLKTDKKLVIVGGGSHSDEYVARLRNMPSSERVVFTGYVYGDTLSELYTNAYLYVLPSEIEGRAITLLEALSYGNCTLVSDIPENVEVVQAYGHTFHAGDVNDLAQQLQRLLDDPILVKTTRRQVREMTTAWMSWDRVVDETEAVYRALL